jgi:hypothetical protein
MRLLDHMEEDDNSGVFIVREREKEIEREGEESNHCDSIAFIDNRYPYPDPSPASNGIRQYLKADTIAYSFAISVCVESQQWGLALELLERMELTGKG